MYIRHFYKPKVFSPRLDDPPNIHNKVILSMYFFCKQALIKLIFFLSPNTL